MKKILNIFHESTGFVILRIVAFDDNLKALFKNSSGLL